VADDEAEVALFGAGGHLEAAFGCVGEAVDFGEGHFGFVCWVLFQAWDVIFLCSGRCGSIWYAEEVVPPQDEQCCWNVLLLVARCEGQ
jgi:hypothetical protein